MKIFGKPLSAYVAFAKGLIIAVLVVGIVRLAMSLGGMPNTTVRWFSITVVMWIGVIYYAIRVHTARFGSYRHLLPIAAIANIVAQSIAIAGIAIAMVTGVTNIFSTPEYSFGTAPLAHIAAHIFIG